MRGFVCGVALTVFSLAPLVEAPAQDLQPAGEPVAEREEGGAPSVPAGPLRLEVSVGERVLRVYAGEEMVQSYPVAVGKPNHPTPKGKFSIERLIWNPSWVPPKAGWARGKKPRQPGDPQNPMGRVKLFFSPPDYYIHGTNNEESLGQAASHGCVRMSNEDVVELAQLVMERGGEPRSPDWFQRILNRVRSSSTVRLSHPVPVVIVP